MPGICHGVGGPAPGVIAIIFCIAAAAELAPPFMKGGTKVGGVGGGSMPAKEKPGIPGVIGTPGVSGTPGVIGIGALYCIGELELPLVA